MKPSENDPTAMTWEDRGDRARQIIREYRDLLSGYAPVPPGDKLLRKARASVKPKPKPKPKALSASDLPTDMREALERYKRNHRGSVQLVAYITAGGSNANRSISRFAELPPEEELVILAVTETAASVSYVEARSQVLMLRSVGKR